MILQIMIVIDDLIVIDDDSYLLLGARFDVKLKACWKEPLAAELAADCLAVGSGFEHLEARQSVTGRSFVLGPLTKRGFFN